MRNYTVIWVDKDKEFAMRLCLYARQHFKGLLELIVCDAEQGNWHEIWRDKADLVVISADEYSQNMEEWDIPVIIVHEGSLSEELLSKEKIFKYQSAEAILSVLMNFRLKNNNTEFSIGPERAEIIGIGGGASALKKLEAGLLMAELLSEKKKTLFVDISQCSGFSTILEDTFSYKNSAENDQAILGDVSELLYAQYAGLDYREKERRFNMIIRTDRDFDYFLSPSNPENVSECNGEIISKVISFLAGMGKYGYIVLLSGPIVEKFDRIIDMTHMFFIVKDADEEDLYEKAFLKYIDTDSDSPRQNIFSVQMLSGQMKNPANLRNLLFSENRRAVEEALSEFLWRDNERIR